MKRWISQFRDYRPALAALAVLALTACYTGVSDDAAFLSGKSAEPAASSVSRSDMPLEAELMMESADAVGSIAPVEPENDASPSAGRKRVYNGSAGIVVDDAAEIRLQLEKMATDSGGFVEESYAEYVVLRIPAARFQDAFDRVLSSGRVEYSRVETRDVTEAYADMQRYLDTAIETRNRLYILLDQSTDPGERARILREIGRLTEEIESLKQQVALMDSRIAFSRISIQLIPRIQGSVSRNEIPFPWIAWLDPLSPVGDRLKASVDIPLGDDWAVFDRESVFIAESVSRDHLLISTINNSPRGDADFWSRALSHHLDPYYASVRERTVAIGEQTVSGVELVSKDQWPFRYFVGVVPDGSRLHVVEIFSPDAGASFDSIYEFLAEGEWR